MKQKVLTRSDIVDYADDILRCYNCNRLIFDMDSPLSVNNNVEVCDFLIPYAEAEDSLVLGVVDDTDKYLYGLVIFDNIRTDGTVTTAQVHIVTDKAVFGKTIKMVYEDILNYGLIDIIYCEIPQIAVQAIGMCKRLGFKKTGYIPKALPYTNCSGEKKLYDLNIFVRERGKK